MGVRVDVSVCEGVRFCVREGGRGYTLCEWRIGVYDIV